MEPEKIPLSTLSKMDKGEIPMTEEGKRQITGWNERMQFMLPSTTALQIWSQQQTNALAVMQRTLAAVSPLAISPISTGAFAVIQPLAISTIKIASITASFPKLPNTNIGANLSFGIKSILEELRPFSEHIKKVAVRYREIKATALEVYENEKELYYKEYGVRVPYEQFWEWLVRQHDELPIWETFSTITYESIAHDYGQYIAATRHKRIKNHTVHFKMINDFDANDSLPPQLLDMQQCEYLATKEFREGPLVEHCSGLVNQRFGQTFKGVPFYNGIALAVVESNYLQVQERLDDENNLHEFKFIDTTIDGSNYIDAYKKGFKKGIGYFEKEYSSSAAYGPFAGDYAANLHKHYKHGADNVGIGWEWHAKEHSVFITATGFHDYGYYAGLCYSIDCLAYKHPHLADALYKCSNADSVREKTNQLPTPQTLFDIWIENLDADGNKPYYSEVIQTLIQHDYIQKVGETLQWRKQKGHISYCAGFIQTSINKGWVKQVHTAPDLVRFLNNTFCVGIGSTTTFKQDALYALDSKYLIPFKSMRQNSK